MNAFKSTVLEALNILPVRFKNSLLHLSFNIARPEFDRFSHLYAYAPNMEMGLSALAARGMWPKTVVDVGAFEGDWSKMARRIWPDCKIIMFEPNCAKLDKVSMAANSLGADLYSDLLGAEEGAEVIFNIMESGSSIMNERSPVIRSQETRTLRRIENVIPKLEGPAFVKIDVQGYELEILKGAMNILDCTEAILLEVSIIEINEGAPLLAEVTSFMKSIGFIACEILEIHRRPLDLALNQIDIVFVRENSQLLADKRHFA
jgi:FkbM family methyltransferase